jgi:hypothetical protein
MNKVQVNPDLDEVKLFNGARMNFNHTRLSR